MQRPFVRQTLIDNRGHILDTDFDLEKNVVNDALHFCLRVDTQKVPADLLRAYTQVELEGLSRGVPIR